MTDYIYLMDNGLFDQDDFCRFLCDRGFRANGALETLARFKEGRPDDVDRYQMTEYREAIEAKK